MFNVSAETLEDTKEEEILELDPAELYRRLKPESKQLYLDRAAELAKAWDLEKAEICKAAVALSSEHHIDPNPERRLLSHVGYYLLDDSGVAALARRLGVKAEQSPITSKFRRRSIVSIYLAGSFLLTVLLCKLFIHRGDPILISIFIIPSLFLIACRTVWSWITAWLSHFSKPRLLPQLDLRESLPPQYRTLVAIPVLLLGKDHARDLVQVLKTHFAAVQDPNIFFVLLTDLPDSDRQDVTDEGRAAIDLCMQLIGELNEKPDYVASKPFFLLHRTHRFCSTQGRWMGWERKRGKLHQLLSYIASSEDAFAERIGEIRRLREVKYVVVLDEDSRIGKNTIQDLVGAHAHPLNHPHVAKTGDTLCRGYGILQPLISVIVSRKGRDDEQWRPKRVYFHEVFDQCSYCGKGIINVSAYQSILSDAVPEQCVLSHDIVESGLLRTGSVANVNILEPELRGHTAFCLRRHRWMRGDWQNARFLLRRLRGRKLSVFGKISIADLLMSAFGPIAIMTVALRGIAVVHAGLIDLAFISTSVYSFEALWMAARAFRRGQFLKARRALFQVLVFPIGIFFVIGDAAHEAAISMDAMVRTLYRLISGRKLLEWQTAASTEKRRTRLNICTVYRILEAIVFSVAGLSIWTFSHNIPLSILLLIWALHPSVWFFSRGANE